MEKKRLLITGVSGLLGSNLSFYLRDDYDVLGVYHAHTIAMDGIQTRSADIASGNSVQELIKNFNPEVVIHCAAQADVEICESRPGDAWRINVFGTKNLVDGLNGAKTKFIYISTDLVYDGEKGNFGEDDPVNPLNYYGKTKCEGEQEALKAKNVLVLRTNFFGWNILDKFSIGEWVVHELTNKRTIQGFTDSIFSSIYIFELAKIVDLAIRKDLSGIYNCSSSTSISKYEFALAIADKLGLNKDLINPISVDDFGFKAKRGKNLSLNTNKLSKDLSVEIPSILYSIGCFVKDFKEGLPELIKSQCSFGNTYPLSLDVIPYGRQCIGEDDIAAVVEVLKSESITQGPRVQKFESDLCRMTDASFAVTVNSGTSALHIACLAAGIGGGDEVITSPNTFVASANCVVYCGGDPVFADIDPHTYNISPEEIKKRINERTKAVIPVHFSGQSCDMSDILEIVRDGEKRYGHKIYIIEDACHALGSEYRNTKVGSCAYSDMAVMSFHPVKHITTGEGGCVLTNDKGLWRKLSYFRSHGITSDPDEFIYKENAFEKGGADSLQAPIQKRWYYEQNCLGYNYRITEIQCALGISQLKKIDAFRRRRREIVDRYNAAFEGLRHLTIPFENDLCDSNFHLYVLQFDFEAMGMGRARLMAELRKERILTQAHYIPVHTQPFYREKFGTGWGDCPIAEQYYERCLSLPLFPVLTDEDIKTVIKNVKELIRG